MWMGYGGAWPDDAPVEVVVGHSYAPPGTEETALPVSRTRRRPRVHYEDYIDFNDASDRDNELVRLGELELLPRQVLFDVDLEAYKAVLNDFIAEHDREDDSERPVAQDEEQGEETE